MSLPKALSSHSYRMVTDMRTLALHFWLNSWIAITLSGQGATGLFSSFFNFQTYRFVSYSEKNAFEVNKITQYFPIVDNKLIWVDLFQIGHISAFCKVF